MRKFYQEITLFALIFILIVPFTLYNCAKQDEEPDPPELPPVESFVLSFDNFETDADTTNLKVGTYYNWSNAAVPVVVWSVLINLYSSVPVAAFINSFNYEPVYMKNSTWMWAYNFPVGNVTYSAELTGKVSLEDVTWTMKVSKSGLLGFTDFVWYRGVSKLDGSGADWTMYQNPNSPNEAFSIDFDKTDDGNLITYENIIPGNAENGGYIRFGVSNDTTVDFDAFYHIYNKGADNLTKINWNIANGNGQIQNPDLFSDEEWHCWNTDFVNDTCQ